MLASGVDVADEGVKRINCLGEYDQTGFVVSMRIVDILVEEIRH